MILFYAIDYEITRNIPNEFKDALLLSITPDNKCVGIKVFSKPYRLYIDEIDCISNSFENYIDQCVESATELKSSIENGFYDIGRNERIIVDPSARWTNSEFLIRMRSDGKNYK